jgi:hypothetical protein
VRAFVNVGGSLTVTTNGYADSLSATSGISYRRRWVVTSHVAGTRRVTVTVTPRTTRGHGVASLSLSSALALF